LGSKGNDVRGKKPFQICAAHLGGSKLVRRETRTNQISLHPNKGGRGGGEKKERRGGRVETEITGREVDGRERGKKDTFPDGGGKKTVARVKPCKVGQITTGPPRMNQKPGLKGCTHLLSKGGKRERAMLPARITEKF